MKLPPQPKLPSPVFSLLFICTVISACGGGGGSDNAEKAAIAAIQPAGPAASDVVAAAAPDTLAAAASAPEAASAASEPSAHALASTNSGSTKAASPAVAVTKASPATTGTNANTSTAQSSTTAQPSTATATNKAASPTSTGGGGSVALPSIDSAAAVTQQSSPKPASLVAASGTSAQALASSATPASLPVMSLLGTGVAGTAATGCTVKTYPDFIDTMQWNRRRVQPGDCALVRVNPPLFVWPQPTDRNTKVAWTLSVRKANAGATVLTKTSTVPRLDTGNAPLSVGDYEWSVTYTNTSNSVKTSAWRRFSIARDAINFVMPTGDALAISVAAKTSPRALPAGSSFSAIAATAQAGDYKNAYLALIKQATAAKTAAIPTPPDSRATLPTSDSLMSPARDERKAIEALGFASYFTNDASYRTAGINRLMSLANWSPTGLSSDANQDQVNREIHLALAQGLDLFRANMTAAQRTTVANALKARLNQVVSKFSNFDADPYDSHLVSAVNFATESLLYVTGLPEIPEASALLSRTWDTYKFVMNTWGGQDGGFGGGVPYGWYAFTQIPRTLSALRIIGGIDMVKHPYNSMWGDYLIAFTAPASTLYSAFGDGLDTTSLYTSYSWDEFRLFSALTKKATHEWYWRALATNPGNTMYISPWHLMMLGTGGPVAMRSVAASTDDAWASVDTGQVAIHSKAADPLRSSLFFRSSPFGSDGHGFADHNAFTFDSRGQNVLISAGYYPWYKSAHHVTVNRATRYKNALTFNGGIGQSEPGTSTTAQPIIPGNPAFSMDARGQIINFADTGVWAAATGDATLAYRTIFSERPAATLLTAAIRSVAYNRTERVALIYDWATSATPRSWELNFHAFNAFDFVNKSVRVQNKGSSACFDVYNLPGSFNQVTGFAVAPENAKPNQWHGRFTAASPSSTLTAVTVIREDCRTVPITINTSGSKVTVGVGSTGSIVFDQRSITMPQ